MTSLCNGLKPRTHLGQMFLIIWDESIMADKMNMECLNRSLQQLYREDSIRSLQLFAGITCVFGGDLRQILPVVIHGGRPDIVPRVFTQSFLWQHVTV